MLRTFLRKPSYPYFGEKQDDGTRSGRLQVEGWGSITALPLETTGPGVSPEGCRSALEGTQKNNGFLSCLQLKIRWISTLLEQPGQRKGLKGGQCGQTCKEPMSFKSLS